MLGVRRLERAANIKYCVYTVSASDWAGTVGYECVRIPQGLTGNL